MTYFRFLNRIRHPLSVPLGALAAVGLIAWLSSGGPPRIHGQGPVAIPGHSPSSPFPMPEELRHTDLLRQPKAVAHAKSAGCITCHEHAHDPHFGHDKPATFHLGCCDCHGGNPQATTKEQAHVHPRFPEAWRNGSGNPVRTYTLLNHETPEFVRFVNPGDLRIAHISCGTANCHPKEVLQNRTSMMSHGCMLWGAALYNNGAFPLKWPRFGGAYSMNGTPLRLQTWPPPTEYEMAKKGVLPYLDPLPRFEQSQPGNILRIFERGGRFRAEIGIPEREEESGRPRARLSVRGLGTENRTDPTMVGVQRTRLFDPTTNFLGTNDHPGDYRSSGCTSCHVIYGNDRSPVHSGPYAKYGHLGTSFNPDPTIPKDERGHPITHRFTTAIPTSQCIVCHVHPGTNVMNSYLGYMWWDQETDGEFMYPHKQKYPTAEEYVRSSMNNPEEASLRGLWSDPRFLERVTELNPHLKHTHFADFHGHGWVFRAVFKKDRHGHYLDHQGRIVPHADGKTLMASVKVPEAVKEQYRDAPGGVAKKNGPCRDNLPVHLLDIHLEKGMHCIDCHFVQDNHGNTKLYGEVRAAIEIQCIDCHGTVTQRPTLKTTGPAAKEGGRDLSTMRTPFGKRRFERKADEKGNLVLVQNSMVEKGLSWEVPQVVDVVTPGHPRYNQKGHLAKTVRFKKDSNVFEWGDVPDGCEDHLAHCNKNMHCIACHSSWNPSCFGCHLPQKANMRMPHLHFEGDVTRNYVAYNFQTLRDDVYMLARDGDVTCNRIGPARSSCAVHVTSYNGNRDTIYIQQQTISSDGLSGVAFSTNVPHTVRGGPPRKKDGSGRAENPDAYLPGRSETKQCTDCHVSKKEDNNAILAQLLMHGTGYTNFIGRYCWIAAKEHGLFGVIVTELDEPQAVIGSSLHKLAFPDFYKHHVEKKHRELEHAHEHPGLDISQQLLRPFKKANILQVQPRGEFLYAACGEYGVRAFDIAFIDNKSFAERILTAPVSPAGQQLYVKTKYAAALAAPCTPAPDPTRKQNPLNREPKIHPLFGYLYVADKYEGLILIGAGPALTPDPTARFFQRELTFNPDGILNGARAIGIVGTYCYILCDAGLVVIDIDDPKCPKVTSVIGEPTLKKPHALAAQFRYAFILDEEGVKVADITDPARPRAVGHLELEDAHSIYLARTYAYVAAGKKGLVVLDIEKPEHPKVALEYNAHGAIKDALDVKLGITYTSQFAYIADGKHGLRVVQLTSPDTPGNSGFSPKPKPHLIATYKVPGGGEVISVGRGLDRDRAVDEAGNQIGVFGRVGARPLNLAEQQKMFLRRGEVWKVSDDPQDYPPPRPQSKR
ncbi:MAG: hypothetical protein L0Z62_25130 [Gemmataceae bacterium]|nr:hypothetical protein [Gemmataceae bacterium]